MFSWKKYFLSAFLVQRTNHFCRLRILRNTLYWMAGPWHLYFCYTTATASPNKKDPTKRTVRWFLYKEASATTLRIAIIISKTIPIKFCNYQRNWHNTTTNSQKKHSKCMQLMLAYLVLNNLLQTKFLFFYVYIFNIAL